MERKAASPIGDIRHPTAKRKNNPPAKIAAEGSIPVIPRAEYAYNPHLPPVLRFDQEGKPDALGELLAKARRGPLSDDEVQILAEALRAQEPWLEWTGKREQLALTVDPVALHIHERVSAQAILKVAARQDVSRWLFADPEQEYHEAVQFYKYDVDWSNRLILGDSLQVMSSLARREDLAGKLQMIYMDPPYGIKFASNFQPEVGKRDVKDRQEDLTREPEMVRAYRDTWHLGIHSYLSYLRDRLVVAKELLADTGSIFLQINDENLHRVQQLMDEVFSPSNYIVTIVVQKKGSQKGDFIQPINDYLLWYARSKERAKFRPIYDARSVGSRGGAGYRFAESLAGETRLAPEAEDQSWTLFASNPLTSGGIRANQSLPFEHCGRRFEPGEGACWKTKVRSDEPGLPGMERLRLANRLFIGDKQLRFRSYMSDFQGVGLTNFWTGLGGAPDPVYVVQTNPEIIQRCILMTTDPGDLVLDPTCGSGTMSYVAEQWGRRWITIDTSRVAIAIARQRLLTAKFDHYKLRALNVEDRRRNPAGSWLRDENDLTHEPRTFACKTVPHITLKSIAQNVALDAIFARYEPVLEGAHKSANDILVASLKKDPALRTRVAGKLTAKERNEGRRAVTDADRRRWVWPPDNREKGVRYTVDAAYKGWYPWEVPFDTDPDWPADLQEAVTSYRKIWRTKMDEVNACIAASAEQEELLDQPEIVKSVVRVSGPFSVEAVQPPEISLVDVVGAGAEFDGQPDELVESFPIRTVEAKYLDVANVGAYLEQMFRYLRTDGVRFLNNKQMRWTRLEPLFESGKASGFHAEGRWVTLGEEDKDPDGPNNVGVVFGPQYGPITAKMVEELIKPAGRLYDHLVLAAFNLTAEAQVILSEATHPKLNIHFAHIRPDINPGMNGLLKESVMPGRGQLFTVFGQPAISVKQNEDGQYVVTLERVVIYNPVTDEIVDTKDTKVAAWFLDSDYDGRTFCITQAFFPDKSAWENLAKALNGKDGLIDARRFEAFSGTTSLPFPKGKYACAAIKVIDPRGNEVMTMERLT